MKPTCSRWKHGRGKYWASSNLFSCHHTTLDDHRCAGTDLASAGPLHKCARSGLELEQGFPEGTQSPARTCARARTAAAREPCFVFLAHCSRTPRLPARPGSARTLRGGRKHLGRRGGDAREEGCAWEAGARAPRPDRPAALTEVQELLHGERRRREASVEVHLARNALLRRRPGARGRGQAAAGAGDGAERPDARAAPQQPRQPHPEPRRRSRSPRRQPAALTPLPGRYVRDVAGRGGPRGRGAAVGAAAAAPSLWLRPPVGGAPRGRVGEKGALVTAPPRSHALVGGAPRGRRQGKEKEESAQPGEVGQLEPRGAGGRDPTPPGDRTR